MLQGIKGVNSKAGQKVWVCFDLMSTFVNTVAVIQAGNSDQFKCC